MKEEGGGALEFFRLPRRGLLKNEPLARGAAKISSFEFQYLHPPLLVILNELSLKALSFFPVP